MWVFGWEGEIVGVVGESGCGKSSLGSALPRLLPPNGRIVSGRVTLEGQELLSLRNNELRELRGRRIAMIFQDPLTSLNPTFTIGAQMVAARQAHGQHGRDARKEYVSRATSLLTRVGIPDAANRLRDYPHEFSGGMRQRIMIAMALSQEPDIIVADEPTASLDVTLAAQILQLLVNLCSERGTSVLLISHELGVITRVCDRVLVMYAGSIVESGSVEAVFGRPRHPYTEALLRSVPLMSARTTTLRSIPGTVPNLLQPPSGCAFAPRCIYVKAACRRQTPALLPVEAGLARCLKYDAASSYDTSATE